MIAPGRATWSQIVVLAAIVDTLMCLPVGALLALLGYAVFGIPFHDLLTFQGTLNAVQGVLAWWALGFLAALPYAALCAPTD